MNGEQGLGSFLAPFLGVSPSLAETNTTRPTTPHRRKIEAENVKHVVCGHLRPLLSRFPKLVTLSKPQTASETTDPGLQQLARFSVTIIETWTFSRGRETVSSSLRYEILALDSFHPPTCTYRPLRLI